MRLRIPSDNLNEALRRLWGVMYLNTPMVHGVGTLSGGDGIARSSDNIMRNATSIVPRDRAVKLIRIFGAAWLAGTDPLDFPASKSSNARRRSSRTGSFHRCRLRISHRIL